MGAARSVSATFEALPAPVATVTVTPGLTTLDEGQTVPLVATPRDAAGNALTGRTVTWNSADPSIATVSSTGLVTALAEGDTVVVTATSEGTMGQARIVVRSLFFIAENSSVGGRHACAVRRIGGGFCWGRNAEGQLGHGGVAAWAPVTPVDGPAKFVRLAAGDEHSCGIEITGVAWCWGQNARGQLGDGAMASTATPVRVAGNFVFGNVAAGPYSSCAQTTGRDAYCWGDNNNGYLGVQAPNGFVRTPSAVALGLPFQAFSTGTSHQCGIELSLALRCWGLGNNGQLGTGDYGTKSAPTLVAVNRAWVSVGAGGTHTCATDFQSGVWCFGLNNFGQLGTGTNVQTNTPVQVVTPQFFIRVASGARHTCAITTSSREVWCWGLGHRGQLGTGVFDPNLVALQPVRVQSQERFMDIDAEQDFTCAMTETGRIYCWGDNTEGQLGMAPSSGSAVPVAIMRP
jgi:alpha-tubulin suppressor-like RCC1 family protein